MGIEKTKLMAHKLIYWTNINDDIRKYIKHCSTCLDFQQTQPKEKINKPQIPAKPLEMVSAAMFTIHNINYLCIAGYHNKFPVIKKTDDLSAGSIILTCKITLFQNTVYQRK